MPPTTEVGSSLLYRDDWSLGWQPSVDQRHAANNVMLRADNLRLDERGVVSLRSGSAIISGPTALGTGLEPVRVLYTTTINTVRYRFAQVGGTMYRSQSVGSYASIGSVPSDQDVAIAAQLGQVFFASGTVKQKNDGNATREWGISATPAAPSVATTGLSPNVISSFDVDETPAWVASEGSVESGTGTNDETDGSRVLVPDTTTGRGTMQKVLSSETDYFTFPNGEDGCAEDFIRFFVWVSNPDNLELITLAFDCNGDDLSTAAARFRDDYYYHDFAFEDAVEVKLSEGQQYLDDRYDVEGFDRDDVIDRRENRVPFKGRIPRRQPVEADNSGWAKFLVPRGKFDRVGNTPGKSWRTIIAIQVTVKYKVSQNEFPGVIKMDELTVSGGAKHSLAGRFRARVQFYADYGTHKVRSAASDFSSEVECRANGLVLSVPIGSAFSQHVRGEAGDPSVGVEGYVMGGSMNGFYLGGSVEQHEGTASIPIELSERDMLIQNVPLVADSFAPPDNIVAAADHRNRLVVLTFHDLRLSSRYNPETFPLSFSFPVGNKSFRPLWLAPSGDDLYVGTTIDIFVLEGKGDEFPDGSTDFVLRRLGVAEPPISEAVASEGGRLCYLASDGPRILIPQGSGALKANLDLLYQGESRYGIAAPNLGSQPGRFRFAMWGPTLYSIVPEGSSGDGSPVIHVHDFKTEAWRREKYPFDLWSVYREPDGKIVAGSSTGSIHQLSLPQHTDDILSGGAIVTQGIGFVKFYSKYDDNNEPLKRKVPFDLRIDGDFDAPITVVLYSDGATSAGATVGDFVADADAAITPFFSFTIPANSTMPYIKRIDNSSLQSPLSLQVRMGTLDSPPTYLTNFRLRSFGLAYRSRPTPRLFWDSGYIDANQDEVWFRRIFLKMRPPSSPAAPQAQVIVVFESGILHTLPITLVANTEDIYEARLGRFVRGRLPRIVIDASTFGSEPYELYWVEVWWHGTGIATEKRKLLVA